jgi:integrase
MRAYRRGTVWWIDFGHEGKRHREPTKADSKAEALRFGAARLLEVAKAPSEAVTLGNALDLYVDRRMPRPARWPEEVKRVSAFVGHVGAKTKVDSVSPATVTRWIESLEKERGPATCQRYKTSVGSFFRWLVARGYAAKSPTIGAYAPKVTSRKKLALTPDEIAATIQRVHGSALEPVYMLAFYAGLRRSEIARTRWEDFDLDRGTLKVPGRKTRRAEQTIPLHADLWEWARSSTLKTGPVVRNRHGQPYHDNSLENVRRDFDATLPNFHAARRSLATIVLVNGGSIEDVAAILRITPRTAFEFYGWLVPESRAAALQRFRVPRMDGTQPSGQPEAQRDPPTDSASPA